MVARGTTIAVVVGCDDDTRRNTAARPDGRHSVVGRRRWRGMTHAQAARAARAAPEARWHWTAGEPPSLVSAARHRATVASLSLATSPSAAGFWRPPVGGGGVGGEGA